MLTFFFKLMHKRQMRHKAKNEGKKKKQQKKNLAITITIAAAVVVIATTTTTQVMIIFILEMAVWWLKTYGRQMDYCVEELTKGWIDWRERSGWTIYFVEFSTNFTIKRERERERERDCTMRAWQQMNRHG